MTLAETTPRLAARRPRYARAPGRSPLPAGVSIQGTDLTISGRVTLRGWDFDGFRVRCVGKSSRIALYNPGFGSGSETLLYALEVEGATVTIHGGRADLASPKVNWGGVYIHDGANVTAYDTPFLHATCSHVMVSKSRFRPVRCYFDAMGQNCLPDAHLEHIWNNGSAIEPEDCGFDFGDVTHVGGRNGGMSGSGFNASLPGFPASYRAKRCAYTGATAANANYVIQAAKNGAPMDVELIDCIGDLGTSGLVGSVGGKPSVRISNFIDRATGAAIPDRAA